MRLYRKGIFRDHGSNQLVSSDDRMTVEQVADGNGIVVTARCVRHGKASYLYRVYMTPADVIRCLFKLDAEKMSEAIESLKDEFDLKEILPMLLAALAKGAIPAQVIDEDDEDEGDDD